VTGLSDELPMVTGGVSLRGLVNILVKKLTNEKNND